MHHYSLYLVLLFAFSPIRFFAQDPVQPAQTFVCAYAPQKNTSLTLCLQFKPTMGYRMNDRQVQDVLGKILTPVGLPPNFRMVACDSISNCIAYTAPTGYRYILYDPEFLGVMAEDSKTNWIYYSIFAHEIAHHLSQHLYLEKTLAEERQMELEADEWSGLAMALMGATLGEAQAAINKMPDEPDLNELYSSHPAKEKRLAAIRRGFEKGSTFRTSDRVEKTVISENLVNHRIVKAKALPGIQSLWDKKFFLQQVTNNNEEWSLYLRREEHDYDEGYYISDTLPYAQLSQYSFSAWNISSLEYLGNSWFVGLSKKKKSVEQEIVFGAINPKQLNALNYNADSTLKILTDFGSNGKDWVALYDDARSNKVIDQKLLTAPEFPEEAILAKMEEGFRVAKLKYISGQWYVLMHQYNSGVAKFKQVFFASSDNKFPEEKFANYDNLDYYLQAAGFDGQKWVVVMNKALLR